MVDNISKNMGDIDKIHERGFHSMVDGVTTLADLSQGLAEIPTLVADIKSLGGVIGAVDVDVNDRIQEAAQMLLDHLTDQLTALVDRVTLLEKGSTPVIGGVLTPTSPVLTLPKSAVIVNDDGSHYSTIGALIARMNEQAVKVEGLERAVASQGGVTLQGITFAHEKELERMVAKEMPGGRAGVGNAFSLFVNPVDVFCHDKEAKDMDSTTSSEHKLLAGQGLKTKVDRDIAAVVDIGARQFRVCGHRL